MSQPVCIKQAFASGSFWYHSGCVARLSSFVDDDQVEHLKDIAIERVAAGQNHSLVLHAKGDTMYAFGNNNYGQCGVPKENNSKQGLYVLLPTPVPLPNVEEQSLHKVGRVVDIACGESHSLAITSQGRLYSWGYGEYGQVGIDPNISEKDVVSARLNHDWFGPTKPVVVKHAAGGSQHSLFVVKRDEEAANDM